jgi:uncharacterized protein YprB with RNaseH-like and TPR domain
MHSLPKPVDDPFMRRLVALVQDRLPNSDHRGRLDLLRQLHALEQAALELGADLGTMRSIHATQAFVQRCDPPLEA